METRRTTVKTTKQAVTTNPQPAEGLVGFFGHVWGPDLDNPGEETIRFQFQIIRKLDATRYVIQYYSFWDGTPNNLGVMPEADLLGDNVKLYPSAELWRSVADELGEREWHRRNVRERPASQT
jgi:hypothetical protein